MTAATSRFLAGWNSLPDELKLHILKYTVPSGNYYQALDFNNIEPRLRRIVYPLMSCPEIKGLVMEAFYGQNTLTIKHTPYVFIDPQDDVIHYPPPAVSGHVRHLHLHLYQPGIRTFIIFFKIADGTLGFPHLHSIHIDIEGGPPRYHQVKDWIASQVAFRNYLGAVGKVEFSARTLMVKYNHDGSGLVDDMDLPVLEKFNLRAEGGKVQKKVVRYYFSEEESSVQAWPDEDLWWRSRVTKLTLSI